MAAVYLHHAIWTSEQTGTEPPPHVRNLSHSTLRTVASEHSSHPTEPLLSSTTSESLAYLDLLSRQPTHPNGPQAGWDLGLSFEGDQRTFQERKGYYDQNMRRRIRRLRVAKAVLEMVLGGWAIYNTARYFRAYVAYSSSTGVAVSLALGAATTLSLAFLMAAALLSFFRPYLLMYQVPLSYLLFIRTSLLCVSCFLLLSPALINLVLVFAWKTSSDPQLRLSNRCYLDIDVVWSITNMICDRELSWGVLLLLSLLRFALTALNILFYYLLSREYHSTRRPPRMRSLRSRPAFPPDMSRNDPSARPASIQGLAGSVRSLSPAHTPPRSSIPAAWKQPTNTTTSDRRSLQSSRSRTSTLRHSRSGTDSLGNTSGVRLVTDSPRSSEKDLAPAIDPYADFDPSNPGGADEDNDEFTQLPNEKLNVFADRFRSIVNQFTRDTEVGLDVESPDRNSSIPSTSSSVASSSLSPHSYKSYASRDPSFSPYSSVSGFREPDPPDEHVRVLGGFVRRMPTIESLGSHEMGSSTYHGDNNNNNNNNNNNGLVTPSRRSSAAASLSPTRMNTVSTVSSTSRSNSVQTNASHQLMTVNEQQNRLTLSEMGELGRERIGSGTGDTGSTDGAISVFHTAPNSPSQLSFRNQD